MSTDHNDDALRATIMRKDFIAAVRAVVIADNRVSLMADATPLNNICYVMAELCAERAREELEDLASTMPSDLIDEIARDMFADWDGKPSED